MEIPCIASGIPEPKMMWINVEEQKIISKDKNLYIETVRPSDTGAYTCVAKVCIENNAKFLSKFQQKFGNNEFLTQNYPY